MAEGFEEGKAAWRPAFEASVASAGVVLFALFTHRPWPWFLFAPCGLLVTAAALWLSFRSAASPGRILGISGLSRRVVLWTAVGIGLGIGCGILFRFVGEKGLLPTGLGGFVVVAAAIGAVEELLYRGYVQGRLVRLAWPLAVILAAAAHTAYKSALFAFPPEGVAIAHRFLAIWTFLGGAAFGLTRHFSGSVLPPLAAHVLFDILVYGDSAQAPWWVWA